MGCDPRQNKRKYRVTSWSKESTSVSVFRPVVIVQSSKTASVRLDVDVLAKTTNAKLKRAWRGSNDGGNTWGTVTEFGSFITTSGLSVGANYTAVDDSYELVEFGITGVNGGSSGIVESAELLVTANQKDA